MKSDPHKSLTIEIIKDNKEKSFSSRDRNILTNRMIGRMFDILTIPHKLKTHKEFMNYFSVLQLY